VIEDVNRVVHAWYMEYVERERVGMWTNYVHEDGTIARRHEYLGPDPRVAGYFFDVDGEIHVRWWDGFLKNQWMDDQKWTLDVVQNAKDEWVVKEY